MLMYDEDAPSKYRVRFIFNMPKNLIYPTRNKTVYILSVYNATFSGPMRFRFFLTPLPYVTAIK